LTAKFRIQLLIFRVVIATPMMFLVTNVALKISISRPNHDVFYGAVMSSAQGVNCCGAKIGRFSGQLLSPIWQRWWRNRSLVFWV